MNKLVSPEEYVDSAIAYLRLIAEKDNRIQAVLTELDKKGFAAFRDDLIQRARRMADERPGNYDPNG